MPRGLPGPHDALLLCWPRGHRLGLLRHRPAAPEEARRAGSAGRAPGGVAALRVLGAPFSEAFESRQVVSWLLDNYHCSSLRHLPGAVDMRNALYVRWLALPASTYLVAHLHRSQPALHHAPAAARLEASREPQAGILLAAARGENLERSKSVSFRSILRT